VAIETEELNLFTSDPTLLERSPDAEYERAAIALGHLADPLRLRLLHALCLDADTPQKAAVWADLSQAVAEREIARMVDLGLVERRETLRGVTYQPRDGHFVVQLHLALAHGREDPNTPHPKLLARRRVVRSARSGRSLP
jgi:DNA-binding transcriptional ArsR family regulator